MDLPANQLSAGTSRGAEGRSDPPGRETCYRCFRPRTTCRCADIRPLPTATRFVFLMHPKEWKHEKAATGRLAHLCLPNSEILMGVEFDGHPALQTLLADPTNFPVLLFPGPQATNISAPGWRPHWPGDRRLVVLVIDATWALGRKLLKLSPSLRALPRIRFSPTTRSRFVIKQQPHPDCLSTIESVHEVLSALTRAGGEPPGDWDHLLEVFATMQDIQIRCAADSTRPGYRRRAYSEPTERTRAQGASGRRRTALFRSPTDGSREPPAGNHQG